MIFDVADFSCEISRWLGTTDLNCKTQEVLHPLWDFIIKKIKLMESGSLGGTLILDVSVGGQLNSDSRRFTLTPLELASILYSKHLKLNATVEIVLGPEAVTGGASKAGIFEGCIRYIGPTNIIKDYRGVWIGVELQQRSNGYLSIILLTFSWKLQWNN